MGKLDDGLGVRRFDSLDGRIVEVLDVTPFLARSASFEAAVRARAARFGDVAIERLAGVRRIDRDGQSLRIVSDHVAGLRLPDLLLDAEQRRAPLPLPAAIELSAQIVRAVANIHERPGLSHGAITPAHVVVTADGGAMLTDCAFGGALESLQWNREQLWREFRVALPTSATLPRFDLRGDVTQLGATVLAVVQGKLLRADEYPRPVFDIVNTVTAEATPGGLGSILSRLRMWLYQALQLHPRENFASALDAERAFAEVIGLPANRRAGIIALQAARSVHAGAPVTAADPAAAPVDPAPVTPRPRTSRATAPARAEAGIARPSPSFLRSLFPNVRAN